MVQGGNEPLALDMSGMGNGQIINGQSIGGYWPSYQVSFPFMIPKEKLECLDGGNGGRLNEFPTTHEEIHPTGILSVVGNLTPSSDHNQSPRNISVSDGKTDDGFLFTRNQLSCRSKAVSPSDPQTLIVRTATYQKYQIDDSPLGSNAIVAVLAYSGQVSYSGQVFCRLC
ncbi:hypothetical protein L1987_45042 [Smallanthus sonchifolius]|uniref:Uncharacterized protein n=1 Tax=Smallanthus sonchifolius TaxID=185202 RepID=A0ACB9GRR8_9ASTR|nr:hypothetical protein L1987_45042 [Smallanthus sonchifolius]